MGTMTASAYEELATAWGRTPVRLADAGAPLGADAAFAAVRDAAAPFRAGTRFRSVPDVRFFTSGGRQRAPRDLLPGASDVDVSGYLRRLRTQRPEQGFLLVVQHPWVLDFDLWAAVRDSVAPLWDRVGWPAVPVDTELAVGHAYPHAREGAAPGSSAGLVWVLGGSLTVRLWRGGEGDGVESAPERPDVELSGTAGDLLSWPAGYRATYHYGQECLTARLSIRGDARAARAAVTATLVDLAQQDPGYADRREPPYLPARPSPPGAPDGDGRAGQEEQLIRIGELVRDLATGDRLRSRIGDQWARRRSAAGLEPVPDPGPDDAGGPHDRIEVRAPIVRTSLPDGGVVWAANGHSFRVGGEAAERVRAALTPGRRIALPELCRVVGAEPGNPTVLALVRTLIRLRAVRRVEPNEGDQEWESRG